MSGSYDIKNDKILIKHLEEVALKLPNPPNNIAREIITAVSGKLVKFVYLNSISSWIAEDLLTDEMIEEERKIKNNLKNKLSKITSMAPKSQSNVVDLEQGIEKRELETNLINKTEIFKMLALAEATQMPILLVGPPGTAKTKTVLEYSKAGLNKDGKITPQDFMNKIYILETDEGTKSSEVKGMPDLQKLFEKNQYEIHSPITEAEIIIINEIDKAGSNVRNSLLGIMNERFLFHGKDKIQCKWKLFIATCNEIPKEEEKSPFWDRFLLKVPVSRISAGDLLEYYKKGDKSFTQKQTIRIPSQEVCNTVKIPNAKLNHFLSVGYNKLSDRTLTFVPKMAKAASFIWEFNIDNALVKVASIMLNSSAAAELTNKLQTPEKKAVLTKIQTVHTMKTTEQIENVLQEIEGMVTMYVGSGKITKEDVEEFQTTLKEILEKHKIVEESAQTENNLESLDI